MRKKLIFTFMFVFIFAAAGEHLSGMPAFARKYRMSCKTCHSPFPRLKPYGDEFAANGFMIKDQEAPRYFRDTGDEQLSLIRDLPFALRLEGHLYYNNADSKKLDFASPYILKLLSGGVITKNISYYFYFFLGERGKVAGLEDAFLMFTNLFGSNLSLVVGQFQVSDPLFKRELRLTFEDYQIYGFKPGASAVNLTYDRGIMLSYGFKSSTDLTLEILNGSGIEEADASKTFDTDKYKNLFGRISQGIGEHFRMGALGYYGKEQTYAGVNEVWMAGVDASLSFSTLELSVQYLERGDTNPYFYSTPAAGEYRTRGGFAELVFLPKGDDSKWYSVLLGNWIDAEEDTQDYQSGSLHLGLVLRRNFRLVAEFSYILKDTLGKYARFGMGLVTAL